MNLLKCSVTRILKTLLQLGCPLVNQSIPVFIPNPKLITRRLCKTRIFAEASIFSLNRRYKIQFMLTWSSKREESAIHEQALAAAAVHLHQQLQTGGNTTTIFNRSTSLRNQNSQGTGSNNKKNPPLPRSSISRARSLTGPLLQPHQLVNQAWKILSSLHLFSKNYIKPGKTPKFQGWLLSNLLMPQKVHSKDMNKHTIVSVVVMPLMLLRQGIT